MALIKCQECGNQVSTTASACPRCGAPTKSPHAENPITTIQQTSKRLKLHVLFSLLIVCSGLLWLFVGFAGENSEPTPFSAILILTGLIWLAVTKFRIWWHHR